MEELPPMPPLASPVAMHASSPPASPKRLRSRISRRDSADEARTRLKSELYLTKEFIDFDVMKGSAFFHTKPTNYDKKVVQEGFRRALLVPFHPQFWRQKPGFHETATVLYVLHSIALVIYCSSSSGLSSFSTFEVFFPVVLLVLVAIGYGRVMSILQAGDSDPNPKIYSPKQSSSTSTSANHCASPNNTHLLSPTTSTSGSRSNSNATGVEAVAGTAEATALGSDIVESEESDSTDSDDESGNSSSSSDETVAEDHASSYGVHGTPRPMPPTPNTFDRPTSPRSPRLHDGPHEHFGRRRVTVCVWENGLPRKKALTVTELRNQILAKVKATPPRVVYRKIAYLSAVTLSLVPTATRLLVKCQEVECLTILQEPVEAAYWLFTLWRHWTSFPQLVAVATTVSLGPTIISISCMLTTYYLASITFSALADAEVTYHRRLMYAKCFTALTSARRSRLNNLPHFRLKNVVNIKAWISLRGGRTWLKRQSRQRAADEIVSTSFVLNMILLAVMGVQAVSEPSVGSNWTQNSLLRLEVTTWCLLSSIFMLRFMMLGSNINKKYQNTSLLLTEQMNVYLRLLVKPHKKEKLLVSNNVLKLASKLLKELNSPNKVSGITMNPLLYNLTRVIVLSAFSSTASEFFGFKLKLWKMKHI